MTNDIIEQLMNAPNKQGAFSRDPYVGYNTFINSGSFIIKCNDFVKNMYSQIISHLQCDPRCHNNWPFDQYYVSDYVFHNKDYFMIFVPDILNTPIGKVFTHNWPKYPHLFNSLYNKHADMKFHIQDYYDDKPFPNIEMKGYEYMK